MHDQVMEYTSDVLIFCSMLAPICGKGYSLVPPLWPKCCRNFSESTLVITVSKDKNLCKKDS